MNVLGRYIDVFDLLIFHSNLVEKRDLTQWFHFLVNLTSIFFDAVRVRWWDASACCWCCSIIYNAKTSADNPMTNINNIAWKWPSTLIISITYIVCTTYIVRCTSIYVISKYSKHADCCLYVYLWFIYSLIRSALIFPCLFNIIQCPESSKISHGIRFPIWSL